MQTLKLEEKLFNLAVEGKKTKHFGKLEDLQIFLPEIMEKGHIDVKVVTTDFISDSAFYKNFSKNYTEKDRLNNPDLFGKKLGKVRLTLQGVYEYGGLHMDDQLEMELLNCNGTPTVIKLLEEEENFISLNKYYKDDDQVVIFNIEILEN
jgi:hypothetical protein